MISVLYTCTIMIIIIIIIIIIILIIIIIIMIIIPQIGIFISCVHEHYCLLFHSDKTSLVRKKETEGKIEEGNSGSNV